MVGNKLFHREKKLLTFTTVTFDKILLLQEPDSKSKDQDEIVSILLPVKKLTMSEKSFSLRYT